MQLLHLLPAALLPALALCARVRVSIIHSPALPNPAALAPSTSAFLTAPGHSYVAPLGIDNSFDFRNVSAGSYLLDVASPTHFFAPLRVDVGDVAGAESVEAWGTWRGNEWDNKGEVVEAQEWTAGGKSFGIRALRTKEYLVERPGFSPLSLLKNPMILMAGVAMLMMFGMPKLLENMDEETRAEFEERQKQSPLSGMLNGKDGQGGAGNFDAAAWLAGAPAKKEAPQPQEKGITR